MNAPPSDVPFPVGARVAHGQWGEGVVQRYDDDAMVVLFDEAGYKTLALEVVRERALAPLARASGAGRFSGRREHLAGDVARGVGPGDARGLAPSPRGARAPRRSRRAGAAGVSSASGRTRAAPRSAIQRALVVWWSPEACGYGIRTAGRPYWASSKTEPPERATAASAAASAIPNGVR